MLVFLLVFSYICIVIIAVITSKEIRGNTINRLDLAATKSGLFNFMEIWKDVVGYEGLYQVSNLGNIKSLKFGKEKLLKHRFHNSGYLMVILCKDSKVKTRKVHQLVAESFLNHKPDGTHKVIVDHINNIKTDNKIENLQLTSQRHNVSKDKKNKSSKYTGVSWYKQLSKWQSYITINGKTKYLGRFKNELDAHIAYQKALSAISIPS